MVVVEALSCGCPCVVSDVGDIRDIAVHERNSLVVDPLNVNEFSNACQRLLTDHELYKNLSQGARDIRKEKSEEFSLQYARGLWEKILTNTN